MKRCLAIISAICSALLCLSCGLQDPSIAAGSDDFAQAKWIAMDTDSTIVFPFVSKNAGPLKEYELPVLSKSFRLKSGRVERAWVDVCGLGQYELFVNGKKAGDYFLTPGWTMYNKELLYNELDVTDIIRSRGSAVRLEVMLGGGMYDIPEKGYHKMYGSCGAPKLLLCLHIKYANGRTQTIVSDESWKATPGPISYSSIYGGEWYDAGRKGDKSLSRPCVITKPEWDVPLVKQQAGTFVRIKQELPPVQLSDNLYDMRQNCSGIVRLSVRGPRGSSISLLPAEVLKDGEIYQKCMPGYEWKYTLAGDSEGETWQPQFSYTGFRYLLIKADEGVEILGLTGLHTSTDAPETGSFECSDTLFNRIHELIDWAIRSNLVSITTDCPTREKLGWQEQNHLMACSMMYRYDMRALMNKLTDDMAASQHSDGAIPTIAPEYTHFKEGSGFEDSPEWGASFILCPWSTYLWYGDDSAMRKHYDSMKRYVAYLQSRSADGILDYGLGDWFDMGPKRPGRAQLTSVALTATAMYYHELTVMEQIARHLGHDDDALTYGKAAAEVKQAFNNKFATCDRRVYENGSQTGLAMAIYMNLVTDKTRQAAIDALVRDIVGRDYALTAGDVGFRYVVQALQKAGRSDIIYRMNHNDSVPGYAYQLKQGATALTESWQAYDNVSNNHLMLGHLMEWLYSGLGGICVTDNAWRHIVIAPQMAGDITWCKTSLDTPRGKVSCNWTRDLTKDSWTVEITIPAGADAEVYLPDGRCESVTEGNHSFSHS